MAARFSAQRWLHTTVGTGHGILLLLLLQGCPSKDRSHSQVLTSRSPWIYKKVEM